MTSPLQQFLDENGALPVAWAGSTQKMDYLNLGDALSPVMVALCSGLPVERIPFRSQTPRICAVGTIGHGIAGGSVWFWGSGASKFRNPGTDQPELYQVPENTQMHLNATRGPVTRRILGGDLSGDPVYGDPVYGDPVWLLPKFYNPDIPKTWELGVILHLSELADRSFDARPLEQYRRYDIPENFKNSVRLINTVTPISAEALKDRLDDILACKRIVSTSLHGMVFAESYGIPCLYFAPQFKDIEGLATYDLASNDPLDLRIIDLYSGIGVETLKIYVQSRQKPTDWAGLIEAIDENWRQVDIDGEALAGALPLKASPLSAPAGGSVFDHPIVQGLLFQHNVGDLQRLDKARAARWTAR